MNPDVGQGLEERERLVKDLQVAQDELHVQREHVAQFKAIRRVLFASLHLAA
jgi:hypothetical protein